MNIDITVGLEKCKFTSDYPKDFVDEITSAYIPGYQYSKQFRMKRRDGTRVWDGKKHLLNRYSGTFPSGLFPFIKLSLEGKGHKVTVKNLDFSELFPDSINSLGTSGFQIPSNIGEVKLRDYQIEAIKAFLNNTTDMPYRGILHMVTGSGKSLTSAAIAGILNCNTLFLVRGKSLKEQTLNVYKKALGEDKVGTIDAKRFSPLQYTIASVDTLYSRIGDDNVIDFLDTIEFVISDEAHLATSASFSKVLSQIKTPVKLGLTGTPVTHQNDRDLLLHALIGPVLYKLEAVALQEQGHLAEAELTCAFFEEPKMDSLEWIEAKDILIVNNTDRTRAIAKIAAERYNAGKTILLIGGNSVFLAKSIYNEVKKLIPEDKVRFVYGETEVEDITSAFDEMRKKKIGIIVTTVISDTGIDIPSIDCLILGYAGKSFVKAIQRVGRGLRIKADGSILEVVDCMDLTNHYFKKHADLRLGYYKAQGFFKEIKAISGDSYK